MSTGKRYHLIGRDGTEILSPVSGKLGGHRRTRVYGRLDCPPAPRKATTSAIASSSPTDHYSVPGS